MAAAGAYPPDVMPLLSVESGRGIRGTGDLGLIAEAAVLPWLRQAWSSSPTAMWRSYTSARIAGVLLLAGGEHIGPVELRPATRGKHDSRAPPPLAALAIIESIRAWRLEWYNEVVQRSPHQ